MPHFRFAARRLGSLLIGLSIGTAIVPAFAQPAPAAQVTLDPVVVTATRRAERSFDVPASVDSIDGATIRHGQPQINLSETLVRVPGVFAANRGNYAQDLQISSRGYGARAAFGVRGVRLYQDNIPATMPDGQGQTGSFSLLSAQRIEVLRGPFSTLYGNASGGVIAVFTEEPTLDPVLAATASFGNYRTSNAGVKASGMAAGLGYVAAASRFETDGYREHSAASRNLVNAKLVASPSEATWVTLIGTSQYQPESQDPLGLTRSQWEANPRQVDPVAIQFDTRKTIDQMQGGAALDHALSSASAVRVTAYGGRRVVRQYLSFRGDGATSAGGVVDLDRDFGGLGARFLWNGELAGRPVTFAAGADFERQHEVRQGFVNNNGALGALRRDEDDTVTGTDAYAEARVRALSALSLTLGVRTSTVRYKSDDHYIVGPNPNDSGARKFKNTSPVAGAVWHVAETLNVYASYGRGFETPTFAELAYRPGATGLNFALAPATSRAYEVGAKWLPSPQHRINAAAFAIDTDNEIVVDTATGGRNTFKNAGKTRRHGAELVWDGDFGQGFKAHANYTYIKAEFADPFTSGAPPVATPAGAKLPGVPAQQAYGELVWTPGGYGGFNAALEIQYVGKLYVNDRNTDAAPAYTVGSARVGFTQIWGKVTLREYIRVNNVADVKYVGSVIVGDTNGRHFESAPGRNWFAGASIDVPF